MLWSNTLLTRHLPFCSIIFHLNDCHNYDEMQILPVNLCHENKLLPHSAKTTWFMTNEWATAFMWLFFLVDFGSQNILLVWNQIKLGGITTSLSRNDLGLEQNNIRCKKKKTPHKTNHVDRWQHKKGPEYFLNHYTGCPLFHSFGFSAALPLSRMCQILKSSGTKTSGIFAST